MTVRIKDGAFLTGAMYAPFCRTVSPPMEEWENDIKNMADAGFTCAHGFAEWHDIEYEKGKFDFTKIDYFIELCTKYGIAPLVNVATQNNVGFYSPRWLMEENRGKSQGFTDNNGSYDMHMQFTVCCIDDPAYLEYAHRYLREVARHFAGDSRVAGFVLWGEPVLFRPGNFDSFICYCPHTIARFRKWLKEKYKSIDNLNKFWASEGPSDFASFDAVYPPTGTSRQRGGYTSWEDFRSFMEENLASHIKDADRIFKENGANQPTICEMLTGIQNSIDSWKLAECCDIIGISCFIRPSRQTALYMAMSESLAKALSKSTFVIEAQGGSLRYIDPKSPSLNELTTTLLQRAGYGTKGLMYWCWRPRQSDLEGNDFGLTRPDGTVRKKTLKLAGFSKKLESLFPETYEKAEHYSEVCIYQDQSVNHIMGPDNMKSYHLNAVVGANFALSDLHIPSDFICAKEILKGSLSRYKVLILPCSYVLSEAVAEKIAEFTKNGGTVIADYLLADKKVGGLCYTNMPADFETMFGIEKEDILFIEHPSQLSENHLGIRLKTVIEELDVKDAKVLKTWHDMPIITKKTYGKGTAFYIASQIFYTYATELDKDIRKTLKDIFAHAGLSSLISLEKADEETNSPLISAILCDREMHIPSVVTLSNTAFGEITDKVTLPFKAKNSLGGEILSEKALPDGNTEITFRLGDFESIAFYR